MRSINARFLLEQLTKGEIMLPGGFLKGHVRERLLH